MKQVWCEQSDGSPVTLRGQGSAEHPGSGAASFRRPRRAFRSHSTLKQMNTSEKFVCAYRRSSCQCTAQCCLAGGCRAGPPAVGAPRGWGCRVSSHRVPASTLLWVAPFTKTFFFFPQKNLMGGQLDIPRTAHLTCTYPPNLPEMNAEHHTL